MEMWPENFFIVPEKAGVVVAASGSENDQVPPRQSSHVNILTSQTIGLVQTPLIVRFIL